MFNPFEQYNLMPLTNVWGLSHLGTLSAPRPDSFMLGNQTEVNTATPGDQGTVSYWMQGDGGQYHQVTQAQAFAQDLWLHFEFGKPIAYDGQIQAAHEQGLEVYAGITHDALIAAAHNMQSVAEAGFTDAEIWAYAQHEAPTVTIVGVA
jgi:hypothetical protein